MKHKDVICSNPNDYNYDTQMWIREISYLQYVVINNHSYRNTHHYICQTENRKEDAFHMETHVSHTSQEHQTNEVEVRISHINSFSFLPEPCKRNSF
jgi:hypothetical protein